MTSPVKMFVFLGKHVVELVPQGKSLVIQSQHHEEETIEFWNMERLTTWAELSIENIGNAQIDNRVCEAVFIRLSTGQDPRRKE